MKNIGLKISLKILISFLFLITCINILTWSYADTSINSVEEIDGNIQDSILFDNELNNESDFTLGEEILTNSESDKKLDDEIEPDSINDSEDNNDVQTGLEDIDPPDVEFQVETDDIDPEVSDNNLIIDQHEDEGAVDQLDVDNEILQDEINENSQATDPFDETAIDAVEDKSPDETDNETKTYDVLAIDGAESLNDLEIETLEAPEKPQGSIVEIDGQLFFYDSFGVLRTDNKWIDIWGNTYSVEEVKAGAGQNINLYFVSDQGILYRNQFIRFGEDYFYMGLDGSSQKGLLDYSGNIYFLDPGTGLMRADNRWIDAEGNNYSVADIKNGMGQETGLYFLSDKGTLYRNQFIRFGEDYFYMGLDGSSQKGLLEYTGSIYFLDPGTGLMRTDNRWIDAEGNNYSVADIKNGMGQETSLYFLSDQGTLYRSQFIGFGPDRFYMGLDGSSQKGLLEYTGNIYFLDPGTGLMRADNRWIDATGNNYSVSDIKDGAGQETSLYFLSDKGTLYRNQFIGFGPDRFYMGQDGSSQKGLLEYSRNIFFLDPSTGLMRTDNRWIDAAGNNYTLTDVKDGVGRKTELYFLSDKGTLYRNQFISFGVDRFYMGPDGLAQKGLLEYTGNIYFLDPGTGLMRADNRWIDAEGNNYSVADIKNGMGQETSLYFLSDKGTLYRNQFIGFGPDRFYMGQDGSSQKGLLDYSGNIYFLDPGTGLIRTDNRWIDAEGNNYSVADIKNGMGQETKLYFLSDKGTLYRNQFIGFGPDRFYMGLDGTAQKGFLKYNSNIYFLDPGTGLMRTDNRWIDAAGNNYSTELIKTALIESNESYYFVSDKGTLYRDQIISFGRDYFYMDSNGVVQKNIPKIRILLDPGHSQYENASPVLSGYYEGTEVFYMARYMKSFLEKNFINVEVDITRDSITDNPTLPERGEMGEGYDLFLSLHTNAMPGRPDIRGSLIFDMAKQEPLPTNPTPAQPNRELALKLVTASANVMMHPNEGVKYYYWDMVYGDAGKGFLSDSSEGFTGYWNNYGVLRNSRAKSAMLIEMGYHTNYSDAAFFRNNKELMARTLGNVIAVHYDLIRLEYT